MSHDVQVIEKKQITNEFVAYRLVCCGEQCCHGGCRDADHTCCTADAHTCEDSWHTVSIHRDDHESYLEERKAEVAARHDKMSAWREKHGINA